MAHNQVTELEWSTKREVWNMVTEWEVELLGWKFTEQKDGIHWLVNIGNQWALAHGLMVKGHELDL